MLAVENDQVLTFIRRIQKFNLNKSCYEININQILLVKVKHFNINPFIQYLQITTEILHHLTPNNFLDTEHGKGALKCKISSYQDQYAFFACFLT